MNLITTLCLILVAGLIGIESDKMKPKPYPMGSGDTLMVRTIGYEFCPKYCDVDHFHTGHFNNYNCEDAPCEHITINEEWFRKIIIIHLDVCNGIFYLWDVDRLKPANWLTICICRYDQEQY